MADAEPTLGEVMRRLDEVMRRFDGVATQLAEDRRNADAKFVSREVYEARHGALGRRVDNLETDADAKEKFAAETRRQFMFAVLVTAIPAVIGLLLAVNNFLANGGATP